MKNKKSKIVRKIVTLPVVAVFVFSQCLPVSLAEDPVLVPVETAAPVISADNVTSSQVSASVSSDSTADFLNPNPLSAHVPSPDENLVQALQAHPAQIQNLNLLYGTSVTSSGPSTEYDGDTLVKITSAAGYQQENFLNSLQAAAGLYRALQANSAQRLNFNKAYKTYLPPAGSPRSVDREIVFSVTANVYFEQASFLADVLGMSLTLALRTASNQAQNLNLLYGTSFKMSGPSTAYDHKVIIDITTVPSYGVADFMKSLQATASLYRALQANTPVKQTFNEAYQMYLPSLGTPNTIDRGKLFGITHDPNYSQTALLTNLAALSVPSLKLSLALQKNSAQAQNLNLLYGTSFKSMGASTAYERYVLTAITTGAGYAQAGYLTSLQAAAGLYRALQANAEARKIFNKLYKTYLPPAGSPTAADREVLLNVTRNTGYTQDNFLKALVTAPAAALTLFSATSFWNTPLSDDQAIHSDSNAMVQNLVSQTLLAGPWINTRSYSTPLYLVNADTPKVPVTIIQNGQPLIYTALYAAAQQGVPVPAEAIPSSGTDGHITILDTSSGKLYEFWQFRNVNGQWQASWGGMIENASTSNGIMPIVTNAQGGREYWGATATSLPVIGGAILLRELAAGVIPHVLAAAIPDPSRAFVYPAERSDGSASGTGSIPEGTIFRLPASYVIDPALPPVVRMILTALRDYGMVIRDRAGAVTFFGEDPAQYGPGDPYAAYYGGLALWDVMRKIPWNQLQVVNL